MTEMIQILRSICYIIGEPPTLNLYNNTLQKLTKIKRMFHENHQFRAQLKTELISESQLELPTEQIIQDPISQFIEIAREQIQKILTIEVTFNPNPICIVIKDPQEEIKLVFSKLICTKSLNNKKEIKRLICNPQNVDSLRLQYLQQYKQLAAVLEQYKNKNSQYKAQIKELETLNQQLEQDKQKALDRLQLFFQQQQENILRSAQLQIELKQLNGFVENLKQQLKLSNEEQLQKIIVNENQKQNVREKLDILNRIQNAQQQILQRPKYNSIGIQVNTNIQQFDNDNSQDIFPLQFTNSNVVFQPIRRKNSNEIMNQLIAPSKIKLSKKSITTQRTVRQNKTPPKQQESKSLDIYTRLYDDSEQKKIRQSQLKEKQNSIDQMKWQEVLSLLNLLEDQNVTEKTLEIYRERFQNRQKLPQLKIKQQVNESTIQNIYDDLQKKKKVVLKDLEEEFKRRVVNIKRCVSKSADRADLSLQFTI
ncbi:hypothetical protein pb186bvf_006260 [Paramecium bursaria]